MSENNPAAPQQNPQQQIPPPNHMTPYPQQTPPQPIQPQPVQSPPAGHPPAPFPPPIPSQPVPQPAPRPRFSDAAERILALPPISKQEAESCRHRLEKRWYRRLIILNFALIIGVLIAVFINLPKYSEKIDEISTHIMSDAAAILKGEETEEDDDYYEDLANDIPLELQMLGYGVLVLGIGYIALYYYYAQTRLYSVRITERNFPEIHAIIVSYAQRLGMKQVPDAFIQQQSGVLNAFSSFIFRRQYIQINTEIFEAAYREHRDLDSVAFVIAHEISHIYYGHATLHYDLPIWFTMNLPLFGAIASRTREYSCDRLAQRLTDQDGIDAMLMLLVDRHLYKSVDKIDYLNHALQEQGFFPWLVNLMASHPVPTKRIRALTVREGSGELY